MDMIEWMSPRGKQGDYATFFFTTDSSRDQSNKSGSTFSLALIEPLIDC